MRKEIRFCGFMYMLGLACMEIDGDVISRNAEIVSLLLA